MVKRRSGPGTGGPAIAAGYVRVSRDKTKHGQAEEIVSPDTQRDFFRRFAEMRGWTMPDDLVVEDLDYSGYRMHYSKRPGLMQLMKAAKEKRFQYLLIYKVSRLSRRLREFLELYDFFTECGVAVISVTESIDTSTPYGRAALNMLATFAQLQSDELSEYISNTKATQAAQGIVPGNRAPYGSTRSRNQISRDPITYPYLRTMFEQAAAGKSAYEIRQWLEANGAPPPAGGLWWDDQVRRILRNPFYIGKFHFGGRVLDGRHEPLIPPELFYRAQRQLESRRSVQASKRNRTLSGLIFCGLCGAPYNVHHGGGHSRRLGYQCRHRFRPGCKAPRIDAQTLEQEVERRLKGLILNPSVLDAAEAKIGAHPARKMKSLEREKARLEGELSRYREMIDTLFDDYHRRRIITADQFASKNREYLERARTIEAQLALVIERLSNPMAELEAMRSARAILAGLAGTWDGLPEDERAQILRQVGLRLTVHETGVEMSLFGLSEMIPGHPSPATLFFGGAVDDLHYDGPIWSKAQEDYLIEHWPAQTTAELAAALGRPERGVRQKITSLQAKGRLPYKRPELAGKGARRGSSLTADV